MRHYVRANDDWNRVNDFRKELDQVRREFSARYPKRQFGVDIFDFVDVDTNTICAGVNWGAWGTQPPADARIFLEALQYGIELCEELNAKYPNLPAY